MMLPCVLHSVSYSLSFCSFIKSWLEYPGFKESLVCSPDSLCYLFHVARSERSFAIDPLNGVLKT